MLVVQSHIVAGPEDVSYFPAREDMRCKAVPGKINRHSGYIAVITMPTHILTELRQDGVFGINRGWCIVYPGSPPLLDLFPGHPQGRCIIFCKEVVKLKENPLGSQRDITKGFLRSDKLLEVWSIDAPVIELIHRMHLLPAHKRMYLQQERSMHIGAEIPHLFSDKTLWSWYPGDPKPPR